MTGIEELKRIRQATSMFYRTMTISVELADQILQQAQYSSAGKGVNQLIEQAHGVPVVLPSCSAKLTMSHDWDQGYADGWRASVDEITKLGPLYPQATVEKLHFDLCDLRDGMRYRNSLVGRLEQERDTHRTQLAEQASLLRLVREFVMNGVELGYIQMPDAETPDPAHDLVPKLDAALRQPPPAAPIQLWDNFLTARKHCIFASVVEGKSFEQIAVELSLDDAAHVERIYQACAPVCEHEWVDVRNPVIKSGELCIKCHAVRPNQEPQV